MQNERAKQLREQWNKKGNPRCNHPDFDKEYFLGAQSGDYVCTTCGKNFTSEEYADFKKLKH